MTSVLDLAQLGLLAKDWLSLKSVICNWSSRIESYQVLELAAEHGVSLKADQTGLGRLEAFVRVDSQRFACFLQFHHGYVGIYWQKSTEKKTLIFTVIMK